MKKFKLTIIFIPQNNDFYSKILLKYFNWVIIIIIMEYNTTSSGIVSLYNRDRTHLLKFPLATGFLTRFESSKIPYSILL